MEKSEMVRWLVLSEISDDYENIDQIIFPNVAERCRMLGFSIERSDIVTALGELIENGLAKAYFLSSIEPSRELPGMPPVDVIEKDFETLHTYFYINEKGKHELLSFRAGWWPFDDEGNLRQDTNS